MSQNSEQIEAKLCAYLEGELDDAGRAEIEKHLQQNPSHRRLLAEVGRTRDFLRVLPREQAPPDICEAFQGQLERSVLLADLDDENAASAMKISRWPQYFAVAAVVMLAAGLGLIVYFGLPSGRDENYVITSGGSPAATGPVEDGLLRQDDAPDANAPVLTRENAGDAADAPSTMRALAEVPGQTRSDEAPGLGRGLVGASAAGQPSPDTLAQAYSQPALDGPGAPPTSAPAGGTVQDLTALAKQVQGSWEQKERDRLFSTDGGPEATLKALAAVPGDALCYVVTSNQPGLTAEQIGRELSRLQVAYSAVPRPDDQTLRLKLNRSTALAHASVQERGAAAGTESAVAQDIPQDIPRDITGPVGGATQGAGAAAGADGTNTDFAVGTPPAAGVMPPTPGATPSQEPAARPVARPAENQSDVAAREQETALATAQPTEPSPAYAFRAVAPGRTEALIVARNLTRQQADALKISLGGQVHQQQVRIEPAADPSTPSALYTAPVVATGIAPEAPAAGGEAMVAGRAANQPADEAPSPSGAADASPVIREGDALRVVTAKEQGGQTVSELRVGQDGAVAIPGLGTFQCAGLTVRQLQERVQSDPRAATADAPGKLLEVAKVEQPSTPDAGATPATPEALALAPAANDGARSLRDGDSQPARRSRVATSPPMRGSRQAPAAADRPAPAPAPAPTAAPAPSPAAPAVTSAPAREGEDQRPLATEARRGYGGYSGGGYGGTPGQPATPPAAGAAGMAGSGAGEAERFARQPATAPAAAAPTQLGAPADEPRVDVVILVQADGPAAGDAAPSAETDADVPTGPIERFEILSVQLGDTEADAVNVRVGADGTVDLPRVGRVQAESLSADALRQRIAERLRETAPADAKPAEVVVKRFTQSAAGEAEAPNATPAETQPGQAPAPDQQPAPQPPEQPLADGAQPAPTQEPRD